MNIWNLSFQNSKMKCKCIDNGGNSGLVLHFNCISIVFRKKICLYIRYVRVYHWLADFFLSIFCFCSIDVTNSLLFILKVHRSSLENGINCEYEINFISSPPPPPFQPLLPTLNVSLKRLCARQPTFDSST